MNNIDYVVTQDNIRTVEFADIPILGLMPAIKNLGKNLVGCQIGVRQGYSMRYLFDHIPDIRLIYGIDTWLPYTDWSGQVTKEIAYQWKKDTYQILAQFKDRIKIAQMTSEKASRYIVPGTLDFIFIDGDHTYENVCRDLKLFYPKMKKGAVFGGYGYSLKSIRMAIDNFREEHNIVNTIYNVENNAWYWYR